MRIYAIVAKLGLLLLGADACYVECDSGDDSANYYMDIGMNETPCPGKQLYVYAKPGFADIVYFDGGKHYQCADGSGFSLKHIRQNIVGCANGVPGSCCGTERCG